MQSNNPVFRRAEGFNGRGGTATTYPGAGQSYDPYGSTLDSQGRMSIDSVVQKTGLTLGVVVVVAAITWVMTGDLATQADVSRLSGLTVAGALVGFVLSMVNSFKRVVSPPLVLAYAAFQGLFLGAGSKLIEAAFLKPDEHGIVISAIGGTIAAVAGVLAAYKFFDIKVTQRMRTFGIAAAMGFVAVTMLDFVLSFFGVAAGVNGFGTLGLIFTVIGLGLGVFFLLLDFDFVERGIATGLPERESWRAAFGLTSTIVFIYWELLRLLAILRN